MFSTEFHTSILNCVVVKMFTSLNPQSYSICHQMVDRVCSLSQTNNTKQKAKQNKIKIGKKHNIQHTYLTNNSKQNSTQELKKGQHEPQLKIIDEQR